MSPSSRLLLHHLVGCIDQESAGFGPLEDKASHANPRAWFGNVLGELQKRDGAGQSWRREWGFVLHLFPGYFSNFPNAWRDLPVCSLSYTHPYADMVLAVVPPST